MVTCASKLPAFSDRYIVMLQYVIAPLKVLDDLKGLDPSELLTRTGTIASRTLNHMGLPLPFLLLPRDRKTCSHQGTGLCFLHESLHNS